MAYIVNSILIVLLIIVLSFPLSLCKDHSTDRTDVPLKDNVWDKEYEKGIWSYLAQNPLERARAGVIYGAFYQIYDPQGHLLDVGCGEGALSDLFPRHLAKYYHGIDVSSIAIEKAKQKRPHFDFGHAKAETYVPAANQTFKTFKMIVFSEMIYYVNHVDVLSRY